MTLPFLASLLYFVVLSEFWIAKAIYAGTKMFTVIWPVIAFLFILKRPILQSRKLQHPYSVVAAVGLLSGVAIVGLIFVLMATPIGSVVESAAPNIRLKASQLGILNHYWAFGLFLSLVHSAIEEYYWRWFVFGQLRELVKPAGAHLFAGIAFAAHHIVIATQFFGPTTGFAFGALVGVGGIIWSLMYARQLTLFGPWLAHVLVDLGILAVGHKLLFGTYF